MSNGSANAGLRIMALIEGAKGVLVLAAGLGLLALAHRDVQSMAEVLVRDLHLNPVRRFPRIFLHLVANLTGQRLWGFAAAAIVYSLTQLVEAWGLWRGWQWTKWFAVVSGGIYIPIEVHGVFHHFTWAKLIVLGVNTLVVAYLFFRLVNKRRRTCIRWKAQAAALSHHHGAGRALPPHPGPLPNRNDSVARPGKLKPTPPEAAIPQIRPPRTQSPNGTSNPNRPTVLPLLGERAGVRASVFSNCIVPAKGEGEPFGSRTQGSPTGDFRKSVEEAPSPWPCGFLIAAILLYRADAVATDAPSSPDRPWHPTGEPELQTAATSVRAPDIPIDPIRAYSLVELIDLAQTHNPETRFAWERARAQAATLGLARSELYPGLAATALSQITRGEAFFGTAFHRDTIGELEGRLDLNYTVFDFGARAGRINAAKADLLAANSSFNDAHRRIIYQVEQAYYQLLNSAGQLAAAQASLTNAQTVQQAAEARLQNGLATMPDALEARSATAQAEYELQTIIGARDIAQGNLAKALGASRTLPIHVQSLDQLTIPETLANTVDQALDRALEQRPDLIQQLAEVRAAGARVKEALAAYYPTLSLGASAGGQSLHAFQDSGPWVHTKDFAGGASLGLTWPLFDGGARKSKLARARADVRASEANVNATLDSIAEEVWRAYSNLRTAFRQRQSALSLLSASEQSYDAALESYNHGVRNLLDVTAAQRTLAQARSTDVLARTQVLASLAELAFRTGDSLQQTPKRTGP